MGAQDESPAVYRHRLLQVIQALEDDALERSFGRLGQQRAEFDEHQAEMLERARQTRRRSVATRPGKADSMFVSAMRRRLAKQDEYGIAEPATQPRAEAPGNRATPAARARSTLRAQADRRRRSRTISIRIGMTDSTITMPTTR